MMKRLVFLMFAFMAVIGAGAQSHCQKEHNCQEQKNCQKEQRHCQEKSCDQRVACGMTKETVMKVAGNPVSKEESNGGVEIWVYPRPNNVVMEVTFDSQERVKMVKEYINDGMPPSPPTNAMQKKALPATKKHKG